MSDKRGARRAMVLVHFLVVLLPLVIGTMLLRSTWRVAKYQQDVEGGEFSSLTSARPARIEFAWLTVLSNTEWELEVEFTPGDGMLFSYAGSRSGRPERMSVESSVCRKRGTPVQAHVAESTDPEHKGVLLTSDSAEAGCVVTIHGALRRGWSNAIVVVPAVPACRQPLVPAGEDAFDAFNCEATDDVDRVGFSVSTPSSMRIASTDLPFVERRDDFRIDAAGAGEYGDPVRRFVEFATTGRETSTAARTIIAGILYGLAGNGLYAALQKAPALLDRRQRGDGASAAP